MTATLISGIIAIAVVAGPPAAPDGAEETEKKPDFPPFAKVTKDMKEKEGFFTLYHDAKKDKLLARIPQGMLGENFLMATSITRGGFLTGFQWADGAVYWERLGKKLVLMEADTRHAKGKGSNVADVIARTYTDSIVKAVPIVTVDNGDVLIDLGDLLKADFVGLGRAFKGRVDPSLSRYDTIKNFPNNTEVSVKAAVMGKEGGGQVAGIHYSMSKLPDNDYKPRAADSRVGYFLVVQKDWTTDHSDHTVFKRYVSRWRLRKSEPDEEVSDVVPEDQILFYIEDTVPVKYRRYVREGILEWNKAFEAAGLRNAVAVRQQTAANEYKDIDPEDVRYNFIRWIVTGVPFAMGPSRVNPFTGQILDADIVFDDSMVRYYIGEYGIRAPQSLGGFSDAPLEEFHSTHRGWGGYGDASFGLDHAQSEKGRFPVVMSLDGTRRHDRQMGDCEMGRGMARQLSLAALQAAKNGERDLPEEFVGQVIKETVMHEVGHTLGLRHNFKASSWLTYEEIQSRRAEGGQPITASVMDYNPYTYAPTKEKQGSFATPTLGPYDYWAIEYGYRHYTPGMSAPGGTPTPEASADDANATNGEDESEGDEPEKPAGPSNETEMLAAIASRCAEPGLAYATDEDTSYAFPDPDVNRWDNGADTLTFAADRMNASKRLWKDDLEWAVDDAASYNRARKAFNRLIGEYALVGRFVARIVGGQHINRYHKGDPNAGPPIQVVDAKKQREALAFVKEHVFSDEAFQFSPQLLNSLAPGRWWHWDSDSFDMMTPFSIHDRILSLQARTLFQLMNPFTMNRVYDAQMLVSQSEDVVTAPELFREISAMVWTELDSGSSSGKKFTNRKPFVSSFRRGLQRRHVENLTKLVLSKPGALVYPDIHALARLSMKDLRSDIDKTLKKSDSRLDEFTRAHLVDTRTRITKVLEAEFSANRRPKAGGSGMHVGATAPAIGWP